VIKITKLIYNLILSVIILLVFLINPAKVCADQNTLNPSSAISSGGGTVAWTSPTNVYASDNSRASVSLGKGVISQYLQATGFGFTIPTTATINGIQVDIERYANNTLITDNSVRIIKGGTSSGDDKADTATGWPAADAYATYGGSTDLWGLTWAASDINNSTFGVALDIKNNKTGKDAAYIGYVDHIKITVYYTIPPTLTQNYFRWYVNNTNSSDVTDPWPSGSTDLSENASIGISDIPVENNDILRLRISVQVSSASMPANALSFKLKYAEIQGGECGGGDETWLDVAPISSTSSDWRGYDNTEVVNNSLLTSSKLSVSDIVETYTENNITALAPNSINVNQDAEWDWVLQNYNAKPGTSYCFKVVNYDDSDLNSYNNYPKLITALNFSPDLYQQHFRWRDDSSMLNTSFGWLSAEDVGYTGLARNIPIRLRFGVVNTGTTAAIDFQYLIEYAAKNGSVCGDDESFLAVPNSATFEPFEMADSNQFNNNDAVTSPLLTPLGTWSSGVAVESPSNKTGYLTIDNNFYTEIEYIIRATVNAGNNSKYCFRLTNSGSVENFTYSVYPEITLSFPILDEVSYRWSNDDGGEIHGTGGSSWYNDSWNYRIGTTITNSLTTNLDNFQIGFTIPTNSLISSGKMQPDCDDLRIIDNDGTTVLPYYIEAGTCNSADTRIWLNTSIIASGNKSVYVYYGNNSASNSENPISVFDFYDDFNGTSLDSSKWNAWNPYSWSSVNLSGGTLSLTGNSTGGTEYHGGILSTNTFSFSDNIVETKMKWIFGGTINTNGYYQASGIRITDQSLPATYDSGYQYYFNYFRYNGLFNTETHNYIFTKFTNGGYTDIGKLAVTNDNPANFEIRKVAWYSGPNQIYYYSTDNGNSFTTIYSAADTTWTLPTSKYIGLAISSKQGSDGTINALFDWIRVRKYASSNPTTNVGLETAKPATLSTTWKGNENSPITNQLPLSNIRLRYSIKNTGNLVAASYKLQYAPKGSAVNCELISSSNYEDVPTTTGTSQVVMSISSNFTNQEPTTNQLTSSASTFVAGKMIEYPSNQSDTVSLDYDQFTELEYNFQLTNYVANNATYCFRTSKVTGPLDFYTKVAELTAVNNNQPPNTPESPFVNNNSALTGQSSPVLGLTDHTPAFSAIFDDPNTSDTASYYQIQVNSQSDFNGISFWDSGKTAMFSCNENTRCADIIYSGSTLSDGVTYFWRIKFWDNSDSEGVWSASQQFSLNSPPVVSNVILNNNSDINLMENSSIGISWIGTVTDSDGYTNISTIRGKIFRSGIASSDNCILDDKNCYEDNACDLSDCSGNTCNAICQVNMMFFADPTDIGSTYELQNWKAWIGATDNNNEVGSTISSSDALDVISLNAFDITSSINYGFLIPGEDTKSSNRETVITNTGNRSLDFEISGDNLCTDYPGCTGYLIPAANQQYLSSNFTYGAGTTLSGTPAVINLNLPVSDNLPSNSRKTIYWGISIPEDEVFGSFSGSVQVLEVPR
jgi:hypothetical protein